MKYALLSENGAILQACNDSTISELPEGAVTLTDEQFANWPSYRRRNDGTGFDLIPPVQPTPEEQAAIYEEIKRHLLAEALVKRDILLGHLRWFYTKAVEEVDAAVGQAAIDAATAKRAAIDTAINSLQNVFTDPRVVAAIDGEVKPVLATIKNEIGYALAQASPATYMALLALDPL